jgi:hypothetical protein
MALAPWFDGDMEEIMGFSLTQREGGEYATFSSPVLRGDVARTDRNVGHPN